MNFDYTWITAAIDDLTTTHQQIFMNEGFLLLHAFGIIVLVTYSLKWGLESVSRFHGTFNLAGLVHFAVMYVIADKMLHYWLTPLPWTSVTLSALLPNTMATYSRWIDIGRIDLLMQHIHAVLGNLEHPQLSTFYLIIPYLFVEADMWILESVVYAVTATGFVCLAIGRLLGPLFIPFFVVPRLSFLFWNFVQFLIKYSLYRVVASALIYVTSAFLVEFFTRSVNGDYSLAHMLSVLPSMMIVTIAACWMIFKVTSICSDLTSGTAGAGSGFIGGVATFMRGAFA